MPAESNNQVIARVAALLRTVGATDVGGATTSELARATDLARPTVHRLLNALAAEGMVDRDLSSGRWSLGPELYLLGAGAALRYDITGTAGDIVERLARETGESAFLSARRGDETVCLLGREGSFPLRSHVLHEGVRFPLGVASAGLAILGHLPDRDIDDYFARAELESAWGPAHSESAVRERIGRTRLDGYATNPALLVEGSWGLGAAVFDSRGLPAWALSVTGVQTRFTDERRIAMGRLLLDSAQQLSVRLRDSR
ncbi:helix-turn-helix domain-containing protein [Gordonia sp. HNM0687]|uniref:Helix-turn-helix domain-containing protein n=1 Tax=Gordonia mangrovi TaxID=2665643 RepID=A0A6L7GY03_9ACTN|nr:IclR family transcriptional regulator [Gordonia mangrovi]MXP23545.1 helix-turn-helix domain-containing protein [Gordonia mangrovi]UVF76560.1 IclR family transcriptional regulator [Gordonia mangrovi]